MEIEGVFMGRIPQPPQITKMLQSPDTKISDLLHEAITFRLFRTGDAQVVNFFAQHVEELLQLIFFSDNRDLSSKAFAILEHGERTLTQAMLANQRFHNTACAFLSKPNPNPLILSRLSSLTSAALLVEPRTFVDSCGFIFQLLPYAEETDVFYLFDLIFDKRDDFVGVQQWLIQVGFIQTLLKEIDSFNCPIGSDRSNDSANLLCSYYLMVRACALNQLLAKEVRIHSFISVLNRDIDEYPGFVEDTRWQALAALYTSKTREMMRGLFQSAIEILQDKSKCLTQSCVSAIDILTSMVKYDNVLRDFLLSANLATVVLKLMIENPTHTILHNKARIFIIEWFKNKELRTNSANELMQYISDSLEVPNHSLHASMVELLKLIMSESYNDKVFFADIQNLELFNRAIRNHVNPYNYILGITYGGSLPSGCIDEALNIVNHLNAQRSY